MHKKISFIFRAAVRIRMCVADMPHAINLRRISVTACNHRHVRLTIIATDGMCRAHDHCNWAHLQLRRARNHKFRAHFNSPCVATARAAAMTGRAATMSRRAGRTARRAAEMTDRPAGMADRAVIMPTPRTAIMRRRTAAMRRRAGRTARRAARPRRAASRSSKGGASQWREAREVPVTDR
jgi:hypothetical protein